ncbi:type I polyketide synthase [Salinispora cortesiana]|uniref:type I polyketide synthase n=1 Tax=Salinispora cortesiana TaxID=1305843 RepID=UPI00040DEFF6|nr:type I polyketide synthase [Salinispora cortesiana]
MGPLVEDEPVAIIGMAGRFPGAVNPGEFWVNLRAGIESVRFPSGEELLAAGVSPAALADPHYVRATAAAADLDRFDAAFFGLTPREARICDPQLRLFLECAHAALEDAGYDADRLGDVGVFGSAGANRYLELARLSEGSELRGSAEMSLLTWNSLDYLSPLVSYRLGLHGPSLTVVTACSSSLVAVHLAAAALRSGECEVALAGGVDVELPLGHGYWWEPGGTLSRDGHCRPFDRDATGTVFGSGVATVALKRLSDALAGRDHIRAVIRSTAVNNDGAAKVGFAAPSVSGQAAVAAEAMAVAGVGPGELGLVEAHGTGTALGDPIEVAALTSAFRQLGDTSVGGCALGSVKGNIGHLGHASGVAALIKVALSLEHGTIPATVGHREPNPELELNSSPFHVPTHAMSWPSGRTRIAAVNSFGVGGANAHAIVAEAPSVPPPPVSERPRAVLWSARTDEAAERYRQRLAEHFGGPGRERFVAAVGTLQRGRTAHPRRGAVVAADPAEAAALLRDPTAVGHIAPPPDGGPVGQVVFLFPGVGAQHAGPAHGLYDHSPAFAAAYDECLGLLEREGLPVRRAWRDGDDRRVDGVLVAEPLLFAVGYAAAAAWRHWGVCPTAVLGQGIGELTAATVAGVLPLTDAVRAVAARSVAMADIPPGGMLAVAAPVEQVLPLLPDGVGLAVTGGPRQIVVAGGGDALDKARTLLGDAGLPCRSVRASRAYQTATAEAAVAAYDVALRGLRLSAPQITLVSAAAGRPITAAEAEDPSFWSRQLAEPVLFADALDALTAEPGRLLLVETGPGRTLTALARQHPTVAGGPHAVLPMLPPRRTDPLVEWRAALGAIAGVWAEGHPVDWTAVEDLTDVGRVPVPGYPYQRERFWADPPTRGVPPASTTVTEPDPSALFTTVIWQEEPRDYPVAAATEQLTALVLLPPEQVLAERVGNWLRQSGARVVRVATDAQQPDAADSCPARPDEQDDLARVLRSLNDAGTPLDLLVHAGTLGAPGDLQEQMSAGLAGVVRLVRRAAQAGPAGHRPDLLVLTEGAVDVSGHDRLRCGNAALTTLRDALSAEGAVRRVRLLDVGAGVADVEVVAEVLDRTGEPLVALRGDRRWVRRERALTVRPCAAARWRPDTVCVVTATAGPFGAEVLRDLAAAGDRLVLVLIGDCLTVRPEELDELTAEGATVEAYACDVTDPEALRLLIDQVSRRHGAVGVAVHVTGAAAGRPTTEVSDPVGPEVLGALSLAAALADRPSLGLFVTVDRVATGPSAAATALDALARSGTFAADRVLHVGWSADRSDGLPWRPGLLRDLLVARTPRQVSVHDVVDSAARPSGSDARPATSSPTVERLRRVWLAMLGHAEIVDHDNFFDLGGNSLTAVELAVRVHGEFGVRLDLELLFDHPRLSELAEQIDRLVKS